MNILKEIENCWLELEQNNLSDRILKTNEGLALKSDNPLETPIRLDFDATVNQHQRFFMKNGLTKELLFKACGRNKELVIRDITCGLGGDSLLLLAMGFKVRSMERHPLVKILLYDAYERMSHPLKAQWELDFHSGEITEDVLLFDPMFHGENQKSLPQKEMRIFRDLIGVDGDQEVVGRGLLKVGRRLVVKRPRLAPLLLEKPAIQFKGKSIRYDVYL